MVGPSTRMCSARALKSLQTQIFGNNATVHISFSSRMGASQSLFTSHSQGTIALVSIACIFAIVYVGHRIFFSNRKSAELRSTLTEQQALAIYRRKIAFMPSISALSGSIRSTRIKQECAAIGSQYRVSSRAVLDVWKRKTWVSATSHLWHNELS